MATIWKFPVVIATEHVLMMPKDAQILTVQVQDEKVYLWALVDPENEREPVTIRAFGTGWEINHEGVYIGTVQLLTLVWHFFRS